MTKTPLALGVACALVLCPLDATAGRSLPGLIVTPAAEIGSESVGGGTQRLAGGLNLRLAGLNIYVEPRIGGATERMTAGLGDDAEAGDRIVWEGFVGLVIDDNQTSSDVGLHRITSSSKRESAGPGWEKVTTTTTIDNQRSYGDIATLEETIAEVGVLSEIWGTWPALGRAYFPAAGLRWHENFDMEGEEETVTRHVVTTVHLVGPRILDDDSIKDGERDDAWGLPVGISASWETPVFKWTNFVARGAILPEYANYSFSVGLKWPLWF